MIPCKMHRKCGCALQMVKYCIYSYCHVLISKALDFLYKALAQQLNFCNHDGTLHFGATLNALLVFPVGYYEYVSKTI